MDEYSHYEAAKARTPWNYEKNAAFQRLISELTHVASEKKLASREFEAGIHPLFEAYSDFLCAMNPSGSGSDKEHHHWYNHFRDARLSKKVGEPPISQEILSSAAYTYLKGPLRVPMFDRALIDAFIAQETFAYIDRHAGRGAFLTQFGCLGVWLAGAAVLSAFVDTVNWERFWLFLGGLLLLAALLWARPRKGAFALHRAMKDTYQALTGSVVSVPEVRRRVERSRDRGVVWPAELYAVLDEVEARTKVL